MRYLDVWREAYEQYTDSSRSDGARYNDMQKFLMNQVKAGNISMVDKCIIAHDIISMENLYEN